MEDTLKKPLYRRVSTSLRQSIVAGQYRPGDRLPDERQLASEHQVSRATIRRALKSLSERNLIERIQGSGTFVAQTSAKTGYVSLVAVGPMVRYASFSAEAISQTELSVARRGIRLSVRFLEDPSGLIGVLEELSRDRTIAGGVLVGQIFQEDARKVSALNIPWVMLGDFVDHARRMPLIDQVTEDNYAWAQHAAQHLLDQGVRRPAMITRDSETVWTQDHVSAFRMTCDSAGISSSDQLIHINTLKDCWQHESVDAYHKQLQGMLLSIIDQWNRSGHWPDGIMFPTVESPTTLAVWIQVLRNHAEARRRLWEVPIVGMCFDHQRRIMPVNLDGPAASWVTISMADMADQVLHRLLDNPRKNRQSVCDYVRQIS